MHAQPCGRACATSTTCLQDLSLYSLTLTLTSAQTQTQTQTLARPCAPGQRGRVVEGGRGRAAQALPCRRAPAAGLRANVLTVQAARKGLHRPCHIDDIWLAVEIHAHASQFGSRGAPW